MQKTIFLLPLLCLAAQAQYYSQSSNVGVVQLVNNQSAYCCPDNYVDLVHDTQVFNDIVCVSTTITQCEVVQGDCPPGMATVSYNEVAANTQEYCDMLGSNDVARIGFMGSLSGSGNGCQLMDFDSSELTESICVKRKIKHTELVDMNGNLCGEGQVQVTAQDALANQDAYCQLLGDYDIIRLANGGSMDGPGYGCKIRYEDRRSLGGVLCRSLNNNGSN